MGHTTVQWRMPGEEYRRGLCLYLTMVSVQLLAEMHPAYTFGHSCCYWEDVVADYLCILDYLLSFTVGENFGSRNSGKVTLMLFLIAHTKFSDFSDQSHYC